MQSDKEYFLDVNHSPQFYNPELPLYPNRLRSGDDESIAKLSELNSYFAEYFGCQNASFLDFSSSSICSFLEEIIPENTLLAASVKLPYFCIEGLKLYELKRGKLIWVQAKKSGGLCMDSVLSSKTNGAKLLFCSLVDEDTFYIENISAISEFFDATECIFDISNAIKKVEIPNFFAAVAWGQKISSFKNSGIALYNEKKSILLDNIDLVAYSHLFLAFKNLAVFRVKEFRNIFLDELTNSLGENIFFFVEPDKCLPNSVCIGFRGIKARDFIRTMAIDGIYVTNGELCSLALSKPSRILQAIGYLEDEARNALCISFGNINTENAVFLASRLSFKYKQIKAILQD